MKLIHQQRVIVSWGCNKMKLPEIPTSYMVCIVLMGLVIMRCFGIDSWVTASLSMLVGYLTGIKLEQTRIK